ncbi:MAG: RsmB/NOP family class I SAM-dependent RNA methyltransferase [Saprospiraceae bacterium]
MLRRITSEEFIVHPLQARAIVEALRLIFQENRYADKVVEQALRDNRKAGARDRAFIAESVYEIVRRYRFYVYALDKEPRSEYDFWQLLAVHLLASRPDRPLPDWRELRGFFSEKIKRRLAHDGLPRAVRQSIPDWLDELGQRELNERWDDTLNALNRPARVVLRANRLKTDRQTLRERLLSDDQIETEPIGDGDALALVRRAGVFATQAFKSGLFEVQDYSSQLVAPLLDPQPGMRVVDACAGAGGKTLHLSALMQNKGVVIAMDPLAWKLDELRKRARRAGVCNIETRHIDSAKTVKRLYGSADRLLLDVPCSGLGVLRRNPDTKWKLQAQDIENLRITQADILRQYAPILKPGGQMVYATCSVLPSENDLQIARFLESPQGADYELLEQRAILPQDEGFDGFFMAKLRRKV